MMTHEELQEAPAESRLSRTMPTLLVMWRLLETPGDHLQLPDNLGVIIVMDGEI